MINPFSLPFQLNNDSISAWLGQFKSSDVLLTSKAIYKVLAILQREHKVIDPADLKLAVLRLTPVVMYLSGFLEKVILKQSIPHSAAEMSQLILNHLAFLQLQLARQANDKHHKAVHLNAAVQITGLAFQSCALSYEQPSGSLWETMRCCYQIALTNDLLNVAVKKSLPAFQDLPTIALALKRVLLFCLASPYHFSQSEIQALFDFCTQNSHLVSFVEPDAPMMAHVFCWDYGDSDSFNPVSARPVTLPEKHLLFHAYALLHSEQKSEVSLNAGLPFISYFNYYKELLEGAQFALSKNYVFVSGCEQIFEFFAQHVRDDKISTVNAPPTVKELNFSSLALVEEQLKQKPVLEKVTSMDIWQYPEEVDISLKFGAMKLSPSSQALFSVADVMSLKLAVGELFLSYDASSKLVLGISHCVDVSAHRAAQKAVVELCQGKVSALVHAFVKTRALLVEHKSGDQLFLMSRKYPLGSVLKFEGFDVVLDKVLDLSSAFIRYAVSVRK